ncbi:MAG: ribonuclease PH [Halobacteriovoraceae bacterium]|nr:ribonuclease PH [Halobacteriovoraceae bacterium]|tara:strand:- start:19030 stop:19737 length:708 start_codon:yes stop_codon:yes gene_type:complete
MQDLIKRDEPREIKIEDNPNPYAEGGVIISFGNTKVHITASVDESVPPWMKGKGSGWVTAEYNMLPRATHDRVRRERKSVGGRTQEIQRLIGRSLRAVVDMKKLGERQIIVDCDVLVADGGTRTTSISGAYIALAQAVEKLMSEGKILENPIKEKLGALSVGINKEGKIIADLNYEEDSTCEADVNLVMTESGKFVEVQGTAEGDPFSQEQLDAVLLCGKKAMAHVFAAQEKALK